MLLLGNEGSAGSEPSTNEGAYLNAPGIPVGTASGIESETEVGRAGILIGSEVGSWGTGFATATAARIKVTASLENILI